MAVNSNQEGKMASRGMGYGGRTIGAGIGGKRRSARGGGSRR